MELFQMKPESVLISIHPKHVEKLLSGEKRVEFRRRWTRRDVDVLVIYATAPVQKIVAISTINQVFRGDRSALWEVAKRKGGGLKKTELFEYLKGLDEGVAIELGKVLTVSKGGILLSELSDALRPPQSFCFLNQEIVGKISSHLEPEI